MACAVFGVLFSAFVVARSSEASPFTLPDWFPRPYSRVPADSRKTPLPEDYTGEAPNPGPTCCRPGEPCWPTAAEIEALTNALDPHAKRNLHWPGWDNPLPAPLTVGTFPPQPICGLKNVKPLYERTAAVNSSGSCVKPCGNDFCSAAARNDPAENWNPGFVVFPLTASHVQTAIRFARKHNLCVSVAGTGHDWLNRHSTNNGLMIRTTLLKEMDWSLDGAVKLGSGLTFSEVIKAGSEQTPNAFIATGWASTVGVAGWSLGGGHGPLDCSKGLGVDNLLGAEIVTADGNLVHANATHNSDLLWALRGGGGSTWGVITTLTIRKHLTPPSGFTALLVGFSGNTTDDQGKRELSLTIDHIFDWALSLDEKWGGLHMWQPAGKHWSVAMWYWYIGSKTDAAFLEQSAKLLSGPLKARFHSNVHVTNWWRGNRPSREILDPIELWISPYKTKTGLSLPSAILSRDVVAGAQFRSNLLSFMEECSSCAAIEVYHDLPHPNVSKLLPTNSTSISPGFRNGMIHLISPDQPEKFVGLSETSYFSESAYHHAGHTWKQRYWGSNYDALLAIKTKYDPDNFFWCKECVGSDRPRNITLSPQLLIPESALLV